MRRRRSVRERRKVSGSDCRVQAVWLGPPEFGAARQAAPGGARRGLMLGGLRFAPTPLCCSAVARRHPPGLEQRAEQSVERRGRQARWSCPTRPQGSVVGDGAHHPSAAGGCRHPRHLGPHRRGQCRTGRSLVDKLHDKLIATQPMRGRARRELAADLRSFPFGRYSILYEHIEGGIDVRCASISVRQRAPDASTSWRVACAAC